MAGGESLESTAVELEELYLGLRTREGIAAARLPLETARAWIGAGWAVSAGGRVRLTTEGWLRLDALTVASR